MFKSIGRDLTQGVTAAKKRAVALDDGNLLFYRDVKMAINPRRSFFILRVIILCLSDATHKKERDVEIIFQQISFNKILSDTVPNLIDLGRTHDLLLLFS